MPHEPMRTTVIGSYPFPGWLELVAEHIDDFGPDDLEEAHARRGLGGDRRPGTRRARRDHRRRANPLRLQPLVLRLPRRARAELEPRRRWGPPAHDQRGRHAIIGELGAPRGLGVLDEWRRLQELAPARARG